MPLPSLSSKRGVTGCSLSLWLGLSQERVKDGGLFQGQNASCQESRAQGTGKNPVLLIQAWQGLNILQPCEMHSKHLPRLCHGSEQNSCELHNTDEVSLELGWTWETPGNLCATWAGSCSPTTSWPSSTLAWFCTNSLKVLWADRMNCTANPTWSPTQQVNRIISTVEDQHREKLIIETAKMKHKNKLRYYCPSVPKVSFSILCFQLFPLVGN